MEKLVVLELDGDLKNQGFQTTLKISNEGESNPVQIRGYLPANPQLAQNLQLHWYEKYRHLGIPARIIAKKIKRGLLQQRIDECQESAKKLSQQFLNWLSSPSFQEVDKRLREELNHNDKIRLLISTENFLLQKLPWQKWDFFERYDYAEVALSNREFVPAPEAPPCFNKVRILAIVGHSEGIDVETDRRKLETLPNAKVEFLVEPSRQQLNEQLWSKSWDILFFAGHSETEGEKGVIYINPQEKISLDDLKYALKKAIANGLKLAIFNSCDGLGLAHQLKQLHLPQMIVMREPVPDLVAQTFLQHFLEALANGDSLYLAKRQAREKLQGLEGEYPCASWLPVIYQNPLATPFRWRVRSLKAAASRSRHRLKLSHVLSVSCAITILVMGVRWLGVLQPIELRAYDYLMQQRPPEFIDHKILVVEVTDEDTAKYGYPLADATLVRLVDKIQSYQPQVVGLDMHRYRAPEQRQDLDRQAFINLFTQYNNLLAVCAYGTGVSNYGPPSELIEQQKLNQLETRALPLGFSNLELDDFSSGDLTVRRHMLSYDTALADSPSSCSTPHSLGFQLAFRFLSEQGIKPLIVEEKQQWRLGEITFTPLSTRFGGYQSLDGHSSQIMLNYRTSPPAQKVTLQEILTDQIDPNLVNGRVVLIGYTAISARDEFKTPYGNQAGVWIHTHAVSQIISAVTEGRTLIWALPQWGDFAWVLIWSSLGGLLVWLWQSHSPVYLVLISALMSTLLYQVCLIILTQGGWMPLFPSGVAFFVTGSILVIYRIKETNNQN